MKRDDESFLLLPFGAGLIATLLAIGTYWYRGHPLANFLPIMGLVVGLIGLGAYERKLGSIIGMGLCVLAWVFFSPLGRDLYADMVRLLQL